MQKVLTLFGGPPREPFFRVGKLPTDDGPRAGSVGREMHPGGKRKEKEKGEKREKKKGEREKRERERKEEEGLVVYAVFDFLMYAR